MSKHIIPTYTRISEVLPDMWACVEKVEGREDEEPVYTIRPLKTCSRCQRQTVNWTTVSVKKVDGGLLEICDSCRRHAKETPLPLEEVSA